MALGKLIENEIFESVLSCIRIRELDWKGSGESNRVAIDAQVASVEKTLLALRSFLDARKGSRRGLAELLKEVYGDLMCLLNLRRTRVALKQILDTYEKDLN